MREFFLNIHNIWITERPSQLAAALAYFGMFSFAPVIFLGLTVAGLFVDRLEPEHLFHSLETSLGSETSSFIQDAVMKIGTRNRDGSILGSLISIIALFFSASKLFFQLQNALNKIWLVPTPERNQTGILIKQRLLSLILVLGVGLLFTLATLTNLFLSWFGSWLEVLFQVTFPPSIFTTLGSFLLLFLSIALLYKILPDLEIAWRDVWMGSLISSFLIWLFTLLFRLYLDSGLVGSAFEAAGAFAVLLIGINYLAQIILLGAVCCRVYAGLFGSQCSVE